MAACRCALAALCLLVVLGPGPVDARERRPVVLLHGLLATSPAMSHAKGWIEADFPGIYVHNVEIGSGSKWDSLLININQQVADFSATVRSDSRLKDGFNLIGIYTDTLSGIQPSAATASLTLPIATSCSTRSQPGGAHCQSLHRAVQQPACIQLYQVRFNNPPVNNPPVPASLHFICTLD